MEQRVYDFAVVGAGAVGLSVANRITERFPDARVLVLDKENRISAHQTGHNSGVIHSGIYYKPGSYKAELCVRGRDQLYAFCREWGVQHEQCGKVIVATQPSELPQLEVILNRGQHNGLQGVRRIDAHEIVAIEPYCRGLAGIFVPHTGIVDFVGLCHQLADRILTASTANRIVLNAAVRQLARTNSVYSISTPAGLFKAKWLVVCGGLQADRLARLDGLNPGVRIVGFRGDYFDLKPEARHKVRHLIYPVPNPEFPFLGVHFTRMTNGTIECGPNAVFVFKREGYGRLSFNLRDAAAGLGYSGTWKFFNKHWRFGIDEYRRAFSKRLFVKRLNALLPGLQAHELVRGRAGVRAIALTPQGQLVDDFSWAGTDHSLHVLNAPSPAATACLAIGQEVVQECVQRFGL